MKDARKVLAQFAKKQVEKNLISDANTTTCTVIYQPNAPKSLKKFSKIANK